MKKSRIMLLALALSSVPVLSAATRTADPAVPSVATTSAQDSEFQKLETEYKEARKVWDAAAKEARSKKERTPKRIEPDFWGRFEAIGDKESMAWCVANLRYANLSNADIAAKVPALYDKLLDALLKDEKAEKPMTVAAFVSRHVPGALSSQYLTEEQAQSLMKRVLDTAKEDESKGAAMFASLSLPLRSIEDDDERSTAELAVHKKVAEKYPNTSAGKRSRGQVNRVENLVEGKVAPDFTTKDVEDVEFKLSDYRGKVVLLDFWGFW